FVNGARITEQQLQDGDHLNVGDTHLVFRSGDVPGASDAPAAPHSLPSTSRLRISDAAYLRGAGMATAPAPALRVQQDLRALLRLGTVVHRIRDRETLQRELLEAAFSMVPATCGALLRVQDDEALRVVCAKGGDAGALTGWSRTVIDEALANGEAVLCNDLVEDPGARQSSGGAAIGPSSVLVVPLLSGSRVDGLLYLGTAQPGVRYDDLHLEAIAALAGIGSLALENAGRVEWLESETRRLQSDLNVAHEMVGSSTPMQDVYRFVAKVAPSDATVLIRGETGTGKEIVARALHANGQRALRPFVAISCAALSESLIESELFGHERGAFTGAVSAKAGKLETADRGTVFLDEVGELSPAVQAKLLRVLQQREFERVGGTRPIKVDIRLISATNRDLDAAVEAGTFRRDLFFRLNVVSLCMPPLRSRRQDIPDLARHFAAKCARKSARRIAGISHEAMRCLMEYDWPGNVRELENAIEHAVVLGSAPEIMPEDLPQPVLDARIASDPATSARFHQAVADTKRRVILDAIEQAGGRLTQAAHLLGLHPNYLHRLLRNLNLRPELRHKP
ncbi:MAG: sigma 54-interacting transcriptional regulator, partial [Vicinamibacterales bacterium]